MLHRKCMPAAAQRCDLESLFSLCHLERSRPARLRTGLRSRKTSRPHALNVSSREFTGEIRARKAFRQLGASPGAGVFRLGHTPSLNMTDVGKENRETAEPPRPAPTHAPAPAAAIPLRGWRRCAGIPHRLPTAAAPKECRRPELCRRGSRAASESP